MSKINIICLRCGKVQPRTDVIEDINNDKYITLQKKFSCPNCRIKTNQIATKNIQELRKELENNPNNSLDGYVLKLIKR